MIEGLFSDSLNYGTLNYRFSPHVITLLSSLVGRSKQSNHMSRRNSHCDFQSVKCCKFEHPHRIDNFSRCLCLLFNERRTYPYLAATEDTEKSKNLQKKRGKRTFFLPLDVRILPIYNETVRTTIVL